MDLRWAIAHDPCWAADRSPLGAVTIGAEVRVTLRVVAEAHEAISGVNVLVCEDGSTWCEEPLDACEEGFRGVLRFSPEPHTCFYAFALHLSDGKKAYYVPRADGRTTAGQVTDRFKNVGFQVTVYDPAFASPDWLAGAVMYQIFPDRFARGSSGVRVEGLAYRERMGRPTRLHKSWDEPVEWVDGPDYDPVDFYGGTLEGIREGLPYLASLGVEVLYLNPVFEARSNHRYDTADYERIDPLLGDADDFRALVEAADDLGISIVLDAVLSHTGDDSRYFNAKGMYDLPGAAQGADSPFYSWYDFAGEGDGDGDGPAYKSWWGFETLPEVDERDPSWQRYILGTSDEPGVLGKWLAAGARGYRLDVADEIPDDVLERIRTAAHWACGDVAIIGEVWEDATTKVSYGARRTYALGRALDSVMNYPLRDALLGFALGTWDAFQLVTFLKLQQENYPAPLYRCLMNLLSSHDVERVRSVLATGGPLKQLPRDEQIDVVAAITPEQDARGAQLQRMIVGLLYALPGAPCVYYGDERGLQSGGDPFCRATFPWSGDRADCGQDLTDYYRQLGERRKNSPVLREGALACHAVSEDVLYVVRSLPDGQMALVGVNRSDEPRTIVADLGSLEAITLPPLATTYF